MGCCCCCCWVWKYYTVHGDGCCCYCFGIGCCDSLFIICVMDFDLFLCVFVCVMFFEFCTYEWGFSKFVLIIYTNFKYDFRFEGGLCFSRCAKFSCTPKHKTYTHHTYTSHISQTTNKCSIFIFHRSEL